MPVLVLLAARPIIMSVQDLSSPMRANAKAILRTQLKNLTSSIFEPRVLRACSPGEPSSLGCCLKAFNLLFRKSRHFETLTTKPLEVVFNCHFRLAVLFGQFFSSESFVESQNCQLCQIKPRLPPHNRVVLNPRDRFFYYRTTGTKKSPRTKVQRIFFWYPRQGLKGENRAAGGC